MSQSHTFDESPNFSIAGVKLSELPPTPAPSVASGNLSCPRSWTASALHCPVPSSPPTRNRPSPVYNGESNNSHEQTHISFNASLEPKIDQSQMPTPCCRGISDLEFADGGDSDQGQSQFQASKEAALINIERDNAAFQTLLSLANNLAKLAYSLSRFHKPCPTSHGRGECQECTTQALHPLSCDHPKDGIEQCQKPNCDATELNSCLISPVDTSKSNPGIFDDDELRLGKLLTAGWPAAGIENDLDYQEL